MKFFTQIFVDYILLLVHENSGSIAKLSSMVAQSDSCSYVYLLMFSVAAIPMYDAIPMYVLLV